MISAAAVGVRCCYMQCIAVTLALVQSECKDLHCMTRVVIKSVRKLSMLFFSHFFNLFFSSFYACLNKIIKSRFSYYCVKSYCLVFLSEKSKA